MSEITKVTKNPGRVQAGKRLQEWHRRNKQNKAKLEQQVVASTSKEVDKEVAKEPDKEVDKHDQSSTILLIAFVLGAVYILYSKNTSSTPQEATRAQETKPISRFKQIYLANNK